MDHSLSAGQRGPDRDPAFLSNNPAAFRRGSAQSDGFLSIQTTSTPAPSPKLPYTLSVNAPASSNLLVNANEKFADAQASDNHVQFATYSAEKAAPPLGNPPVSPTTLARDAKNRIPLPLRPYFWVPLIVFLVAGAIALEVALHVSNERQGWASGTALQSSVALHYAYTLPPVVIAAGTVALWAWTDIEIKKMQPYVDLVHGDSPPHRSLLLDYTRDNNFFVWTRAAKNQHYLVAIASLMVLVTLSFQPLAAALLVVRDTWIQLPDVTMTNLASIGLNQNSQFNDLTSFLAGAGYASSSVLYNFPPPSFIQVPYTIAPFQLPIALTTNGTAFANTTALKTSTGCQTATVQMTQMPNSAWLNEASVNGCSFSFNVTNNSEILFGVDTPTCLSNPPAQFSPVVFWFFSYVPTAVASATFCTQSFSLWEVNAGVDIRIGNITSVSELRPFSASSNFSSTAGNVTGDPLDGRAYNGVAFNLTNPDAFVLARQSAVRLQLPAGVYQAALQTPQGFTGSFGDALSALVDDVYGIYLALVAKEVYFLPDNEPINVQVKTFQQRVWLSAPAVHLLTTAFLILAFFGTIVHLFHRADRRHLRLTHLPGTIASAVSIGAQTQVGVVLAGRHAERDLRAALADKRFRMNPDTMRIIMDSEEGYEVPRGDTPPGSPAGRRKSMLDVLQGRRASRRFSVGQPQRLSTAGGGGTTPTSPRSPLTPGALNSPPKSPVAAPGSQMA
ncbi:hypothetical protein BDN70DRAFT_862706 [Pholiota conissans]|uniref:Uncharacterized protein n=1 Tax=Pholiota conissans TaxID=109636 RepID=A0A9P5YXB5_9AGAR|nr:hypothetical protein BDN70DRAFT_862706 [Pholiota conissans]